MPYRAIAAVLCLLLIVVSSCSPGPNELLSKKEVPAKPAGFWRGLWHGLILPVTFVISLFTDNVSIYEVRNGGGWYDFGFVLGAAIILGGSGKGTKRRKRC